MLSGALVVGGLILTYAPPLGFVRSWELSLSEELAEMRSEQLTSIGTFASQAGDSLGVIVTALAVTVGQAVARRWRSAAFIPIALVVEVTVFLAVNQIVRRPRPDVDHVGSLPSTFSFPSGHVAATMVCWLGVAWLLHCAGHRRWTIVMAVAGAVVTVTMGWARLYLGMHHLLDIVFGIAMGAGALSTSARALRLERPITLAAMPGVPGGSPLRSEWLEGHDVSGGSRSSMR